MERIWIALGAVAGLTGVAMAALAAHGLGWLDPRALGMVNSAVQIQGWHAGALVLAGVWARRGGLAAHFAGAAFALGTALFCLAVYLQALGALALGPVAPIGGGLLMLGWVSLGISAFTAR